MDGSYTIRNSEGATRVFPDGKKFYMNAAGQKALQEYYKSNNFTRVQTGERTKYDKKWTGTHFAGGSGWQTTKSQVPTYGYLPKQPFAAPKPVAAPVDPGPKPYTPQEIQGLISDTIAKATPPAPEPPPPPPPPKTIFSSSTILDRSPLDIQPASTSIGNSPSFQRRSSGGLNQLKINQTLNV